MNSTVERNPSGELNQLGYPLMGRISTMWRISLTLLFIWLKCILASDLGKDDLAVRPETNIDVSVNQF